MKQTLEEVIRDKRLAKSKDKRDLQFASVVAVLIVVWTVMMIVK